MVRPERGHRPAKPAPEHGLVERPEDGAGLAVEQVDRPRPFRADCEIVAEHGNELAEVARRARAWD